MGAGEHGLQPSLKCLSLAPKIPYFTTTKQFRINIGKEKGVAIIIVEFPQLLPFDSICIKYYHESINLADKQFEVSVIL